MGRLSAVVELPTSEHLAERFEPPCGWGAAVAAAAAGVAEVEVAIGKAAMGVQLPSLQLLDLPDACGGCQT